MVTLGQVAVDLYLPSLPAIAHNFNASQLLTSTTLTVYLFGFGFSQLIYGPLSDYFGRKKVLIFGLILFLFSSLGCSFSINVYMLILTRLIQGFGAGAGAVLSRAIIRDTFEGSHISRIISYMSLSWSLVPILAPLLGGYIQHYLNWRISFLVIFIYGAMTLILIQKILPNTNQEFIHTEINFKKIIKNYRDVLFNKLFFRAALCSSLSYATIIAYESAGPFLIQNNLGFSPVLYGWITLLVASAYLLGNYTNSKLVVHLGMQKLVMSGFLLFAIGSFSLFIFSLLDFLKLWAIIIPIYIVFIGLGFIFPNCATEALMPFRKIAGTAGAALGFVQMICCSFVSVIISKFSHLTQLPLAILFVAIASVLGYILILQKVDLRKTAITELD
jgi:Bcr/CflA subfamily drug resistance transporter